MLQIGYQLFEPFYWFLNHTHTFLVGQLCKIDQPVARPLPTQQKQEMISVRFAPATPEIKRLLMMALDRTAPGIDLPHKYTSYLERFLIDLIVSWVLAQCDRSLCWHNVTLACFCITWQFAALAPSGSALQCWRFGGIHWSLGISVSIPGGGGRCIQHPFRPALDPTQSLVQWESGLFPVG